jgi:hypothetical protein
MSETGRCRVHVPEGATPKDGPPPGVAMATAIVSVMAGILVRRDLPMTGEITLRGRVWPILVSRRSCSRRGKTNRGGGPVQDKAQYFRL